MEIKVAVKIFEMSMAVDKTWHHRFARDVDHFSISWDRKTLRVADGFEAAVLDDDDSIFDRRAPGPVD
jgi:hypothetical protein